MVKSFYRLYNPCVSQNVCQVLELGFNHIHRTYSLPTVSKSLADINACSCSFSEERKECCIYSSNHTDNIDPIYHYICKVKPINLNGHTRGGILVGLSPLMLMSVGQSYMFFLFL